MLELMMQTMVPAITKAVIMALDAMEPEEEQEARYEGYVPVEAVKSYKQQEDFPEYLDVQEVAALLNVNKSKVYELFRSKNFPAVTFGKSKRKVSKADLLQYLRERRGGYLLDEYNDGNGDE